MLFPMELQTTLLQPLSFHCHTLFNTLLSEKPSLACVPLLLEETSCNLSSSHCDSREGGKEGRKSFCKISSVPKYRINHEEFSIPVIFSCGLDFERRILLCFFKV